ncbi:MAG TPA: zinc ribbon domain-containing protein [Pyrinomonadaceae bacterium]|nr:zinc ribbon domain-containing protein [Pyrinomonadaceae bacterium]
MYCPKCSQQQASEEARFCSRCGFQLSAVKELLAQTEAPAPMSRRDVTVGAVLMFFVGLFVVLYPDSTPPGARNEQLMMLVGLFIFLTLFVNFIRPLLMALNKFFGEEDAAPQPAPAPDLTTRVSPATQRAALPPNRVTPAAAAFNSPRVTTAEILQPPSVTEHTTNLLDNK